MHIIKSLYRLNTKPNVLTLQRSEPKQFIHKIRPTKIACPTLEGTRYVRFENISHCSSDNNYCNVLLKDGEKILLSKTLKWVVDRLPSDLFVRIHASHLVNIDYISTFCYDFVKLEDNSHLPVSKSRKSSVQSYLNKQCIH